MGGSTRAQATSSLEREGMVEAVAFAAERLLLASDWLRAIDEVIERLGRAARVSRSYVVENGTDEAGQPTSSWIAEWCATGVGRVTDDPEFRTASWVGSGFGRWMQILEAGEVVRGAVAEFPPAERAPLERHGVLSLISLPVFVDGEWWGAIGFDDCFAVRDWTGNELDALRAAATVLGAAIQRQRADERASATEDKYRVFVEHIPAVTYMDVLIDDVVHVDFISPQIETLLGYPRERFTGDPDFWFSLIHPDDRERIEDAGTAVARHGVPFDDEYRMIAADGRVVWVHDNSSEVVDDTGATRYWQGFLTDVTDRREAELQLRDAERRYRELVENIPAVVYTEPFARGEMPFYLSPQASEILGYGSARWDRGFWLDHIHPDDRDRVLAVDDETNRTQGPYACEYRFQVADGSYRWLHDEAVLVRDEQGAPKFWQNVFLDITRRKHAEEQLREAEEKFRTIVEHSQAIFYTQEIDPDDPTLSNTTYIAPGNTDMIGYSEEEIVSDPGLWREIIHPEDRERVLELDALANTSDMDHFSMEYRMIRKDGGVVWVQDEATKVQLPGRPAYWQGFLLDVTERKAGEEQVARALEVEREAARRLRALDEMKNTFLQAVSHDLRTPLAAILGLAITLERGEVELAADDARDLAGRIAENARKLDRLVTNLLDMDRLARGIVTPKLEPADLGGLVRRLVDESDVIDSSRVSIDVEPTVIQIDVAKVERVVENLLANTARHTPANARIWVTVRAVDGGAVITVEDNGVGVPAELRDSIFEPFQQGPQAPQHSPGVGVGLALVRRFAELHGGRAWVEEREGGGASFRVFLPGAPPQQAAG